MISHSLITRYKPTHLSRIRLQRFHWKVHPYYKHVFNTPNIAAIRSSLLLTMYISVCNSDCERPIETHGSYYAMARVRNLAGIKLGKMHWSILMLSIYLIHLMSMPESNRSWSWLLIAHSLGLPLASCRRNLISSCSTVRLTRHPRLGAVA